MVDFTLTKAQTALRNNARTFAQSVLSGAPELYSQHSSQNARFQATLPIYRSAIQAGLIKGQVPVPLGGTSESLVDAAIVVEEFFAVEPSMALTILGTGLGLTPLILAGNEKLWGQFLKRFLVQEGEPIAAFVHSEPGGTANWLEKGAPGLGTTAYEEGGEWVLNGEKVRYEIVPQVYSCALYIFSTDISWCDPLLVCTNLTQLSSSGRPIAQGGTTEARTSSAWYAETAGPTSRKIQVLTRQRKS